MDPMDGGERVENNTRNYHSVASPEKVVTWTGCVILLVVLALLIPIPFTGRSASALGDLVHAPLFGSLALVWIAVWQRLWPTTTAQHWRPLGNLAWRSVTVWVCLSGFGVAMEFAQDVMGRSMSLHDAISNSLGAAAALVAYTGWCCFRQQQRSLALFCLAVAMTAVGFSWAAPVRILLDGAAIHTQFPQLASFESDVELTRWYCRDCELRRSRSRVTEGRFSGEIDFAATDFPAITLIDFAGDWSGYQSFAADVYLAKPDDSAQPVLMVVKLIDVHGESGNYQREVHLTPGVRQTVDISPAAFDSMAKQGINLKQLRFVDIGIVAPKQPTRLWIDNVRLLPR
ncbi:hypothetical protein [Roseiconus lacunae]|uniref:VanZ-like domain-containing protein n=1 Tax=Roseiconus lacunae TaxID=2605694 RepID=A0ABT7PKW4_9BACT|nr:hypothetical protein [Roseiconus lacunae]MDM4017147.1 hypothetical protein [Roseiconus lacunae]